MNDQRLSGHHAGVLRQILGHPAPRDLEWSDVVSLVSAMGSAIERHDGDFEFRIGTASAIFRRPHHKDIDVDDVVRLRQFLTQSGVGAAQPHAALPLVLAVDHRSARFYEPNEGRLVEGGHIQPLDPHGFERHLQHRGDSKFKGEREPEDHEYYERISQRLKGVEAILLLGEGTGKSSAVDFLKKYLEKKHKDVAAHVVGEKHADLSALTLGDVERIAKAP